MLTTVHYPSGPEECLSAFEVIDDDGTPVKWFFARGDAVAFAKRHNMRVRVIDDVNRANRGLTGWPRKGVWRTFDAPSIALCDNLSSKAGHVTYRIAQGWMHGSDGSQYPCSSLSPRRRELLKAAAVFT